MRPEGLLTTIIDSQLATLRSQDLGVIRNNTTLSQYVKTEYNKFHNHGTAFKSVSAATNTGNFTLQVLHGSDFEGGIPALTDAIGFSAVVNKLKDDPKYKTNTLILSSGDNYISGPFFNASSDTRLNNMVCAIALFTTLQKIPGEKGVFSVGVFNSVGSPPNPP
jgi:2',3'-cyclic-nucleotide 2'-phosphodiesterase (5'-nucleotidase family)